MVDIATVAVVEVAKLVLASVSGPASKGAGRLLKLLRSRLRALPPDPDALVELISRQLEADPAWADELFSVLADLGEGGGAVCPFPPTRFANRDALRQELARGDGAWLIAGRPGAGKTALVRQVAHDAAPRFPHGQVEVDLDGWRDGDALRVGEVAAYVLGQLGVAQVETAEPLLSQQYLRALLRRRFVLILDNVLGAAELRTLAQPWPRSLVLVTVRRLTDDLRLWAEPGRLVELSGLDEAGARQLLADRGGEAMLAAEPEAVRQLLERCDRMPLPLRQVAVRLERRRNEPGAVAAVLAELRDGGPGSAVEWGLVTGVGGLSEPTAAGLRVLATHPGEDFTYRSAEAMLGPAGRRVVDELVDARLVERERGRLRLPRAVRDYVSHRAGPRGKVQDGRSFDRVLAYYRDAAVAADVHTTSGDWEGRLRRYSRPARVSWQIPGTDPIDWLEVESVAIVDLVKEAYRRGRHVEVVQLCGGLEALSIHRGYHWRCAEAFDWGVRSAAELADPALRVRLHTVLGRELTLLELFEDATSELDAAARLMSGLDDPRLASSVLEAQGRLYEQRAEHQPEPDYRPAVDQLRRAVEVDESAGLTRPLGIHRRMLANLLVRAGRPEPARATLAQVSPTGEARNDARVQMVLAKAYAALGELDRAASAVAGARALLAGAGANQYELELVDIDAEISWRRGDVAAARAGWGWIAGRYWDWAHPRFQVYLTKLDRLPPPPE